MPYNSFSLNPAYILSHVVLGLHRDITTSQYDVTHVFSPFCLKILASLPSHVVLDLQRDMAASQYDVAHLISPFLPQITCFLVKPRRVGPPTRHHHLPLRRGSRYFSLFPTNYLLPSRATSHWTPNATSLPPNTTWRPLLHQKTTRAIRVVAYLLYLSSNVQSSLKLA